MMYDQTKNDICFCLFMSMVCVVSRYSGYRQFSNIYISISNPSQPNSCSILSISEATGLNCAGFYIHVIRTRLPTEIIEHMIGPPTLYTGQPNNRISNTDR